MQELGDISGMSGTLHNMAAIALEKNDVEKYLEYDREAYGLALEAGNAYHIYVIGWYLGSTLYQSGGKEFKDQAAAMLKKSLEIGKSAGYPDVGKIEEILRKISTA